MLGGGFTKIKLLICLDKNIICNRIHAVERERELFTPPVTTARCAVNTVHSTQTHSEFCMGAKGGRKRQWQTRSACRLLVSAVNHKLDQSMSYFAN